MACVGVAVMIARPGYRNWRTLHPADFRFDGATSTVKLKEKGGKSRIVPLSGKSGKETFYATWKRTSCLSHMPAPTRCSQTPTTTNYRGWPSWQSIRNMLQWPAHAILQASPRILVATLLRHSKAMHMLEAGINLIYIRDFLGHATTTTTEIYARASAKLKMEALRKMNPSIVIDGKTTWQKDGNLLEWLKTLAKS